MKKIASYLRWGSGVLTLGGALMIGGYGLAQASSAWNSEGYGESEYSRGGEDDHEREHEYEYKYEKDERDASWLGQTQGQGRLEPDPLYVEECASCHLAYPAQLLPAASWQAIMGGLDDHFGDNAELLPDRQAEIEAYLAANAADVNPGRKSHKFLRHLDRQEAPLRITETPYFRDEHDEVPRRLVADNPEVRSFSQCQACHGQGAERGFFDEDEVVIPGHGRWDD